MGYVSTTAPWSTIFESFISDFLSGGFIGFSAGLFWLYAASNDAIARGVRLSWVYPVWLHRFRAAGRSVDAHDADLIRAYARRLRFAGTLFLVVFMSIMLTLTVRGPESCGGSHLMVCLALQLTGAIVAWGVSVIAAQQWLRKALAYKDERAHY